MSERHGLAGILQQVLYNFPSDEDGFKRIAIKIREVPGPTEHVADVSLVGEVFCGVFAVPALDLPAASFRPLGGSSILIGDGYWVKADRLIVVKF